MKILIVDDELLTIKNLKYSFEQDNYEVESTDDSDEALKRIITNEYDAIILDLILPETDGLEFCQKIREISNVPILVLSANNEDMSKILALEYGADDYITKPFMPEELEVRLRVGKRILDLQQSLKEALEVQRYQAQHDRLTGIFNHVEILNILEKELDRAGRQNGDLAVIMGDLDHFKKVNDTYGHVAGDAVLVEVAARMKNNIRLYDSAGRYGGEEFLLVLPGCTTDEVMIIAHRILESISKDPVMFNNIPIKVTISLGAAVHGTGDNTSTTELVQLADTALYKAKQNGRNRVEQAKYS